VIVGIVGSERIKFTELGEKRAKAIIDSIVSMPDITEVVSGKCHLGGIDIWAAEIGAEWGRIVTEFPPRFQSWENGYRPRNIQIARRSDIVHCITVDVLPETYNSMTFSHCYHCNSTAHVKSGGCWTALYAEKLKKQAKWHVVKNYD
jgi:hypothetical protein